MIDAAASWLLDASAATNQTLRSLGLLIGLPALSWGATKALLSAEGRDDLWARMARTAESPERALALHDALLGPAPGAARLAAVALLVSLPPLLATLLGFAHLVPEFATSLLTMPEARPYYLRQFLTEGLFTVFAVNYASLSLAASLRARAARSGIWPLLLADMAVRVGLFAAVIAFVYFVSSQVFGSFGGDGTTALRTVGPTLRAALEFDNVSAAYFYAAALPGLPLFLAAALDLSARLPWLGAALRAAFFYLPLRKDPILAGAVVIGAFFALLSALASLAYGAL